MSRGLDPIQQNDLPCHSLKGRLIKANQVRVLGLLYQTAKFFQVVRVFQHSVFNAVQNLYLFFEAGLLEYIFPMAFEAVVRGLDLVKLFDHFRRKVEF